MAKGNKSGKGDDEGTGQGPSSVRGIRKQTEQSRAEQRQRRSPSHGRMRVVRECSGMDEDGGSVEAASQARKAGRCKKWLLGEADAKFKVDKVGRTCQELRTIDG